MARILEAQNLRSILQAIRSKESFEDLGRGATEAEISEVEAIVGVSLPEQYRAFLETCGYVLWFGNPIGGVAQDPSDSVVRLTQRARSADLPPGFLPVPRDAIAIKEYGGGGWYLLFCAGSPRAGEVVLVLHETFFREEQRWRSFNQFLASWVP